MSGRVRDRLTYRRLSGPSQKVLARLRKKGVIDRDISGALKALDDGEGSLVARVDRKDTSTVLLHRHKSPRVVVLSRTGTCEAWDETLVRPAPLARLHRLVKVPRTLTARRARR